MKYTNKLAIATVVLAAAVANNGTFTLAYPTGTKQGDFVSGLAGSNTYMVVNGNDKYTAASAAIALSYGSSLITVTNQTGITLPAGASILLNLDMTEGNVILLPFRLDLPSITAAGNVVASFQPGFAGTIDDAFFVVDKPATTAAKAATLAVNINASAVTGGAVALTSANVTPQGSVIEGTAITAANTLNRDDSITIVASSVTAFVEGSGTLWLRCRQTTDAY